MEAPEPPDELARLGDLYALELLDRRPNERFDRLTRVVCHALDVPMAMVSLVDADRQFFCSRQGLDARETSRQDAFCAHTIVAPESMMVVPDAEVDPRFADNPLVTGAPGIRFYAGVPITTARGLRVGTLCAIDRKPRDLTDDERAILRDLAEIAERELYFVGLAHADSLTGVANRRAFEQAATNVIAIGDDRKRSLSILCADVDGLKQINDRYGHGAGDDLLRRAARVLVDASPTTALVARTGGDEFAALLYDADETAASKTAGEIRTTIARHAAERGDGAPLSISIGVATARPGETWTDVVARADEAMYDMKRRRRRPDHGRLGARTVDERSSHVALAVR